MFFLFAATFLAFYVGFFGLTFLFRPYRCAEKNKIEKNKYPKKEKNDSRPLIVPHTIITEPSLETKHTSSNFEFKVATPNEQINSENPTFSKSKMTSRPIQAASTLEKLEDTRKLTNPLINKVTGMNGSPNISSKSSDDKITTEPSSVESKNVEKSKFQSSPFQEKPSARGRSMISSKISTDENRESSESKQPSDNNMLTDTPTLRKSKVGRSKSLVVHPPYPYPSAGKEGRLRLVWRKDGKKQSLDNLTKVLDMPRRGRSPSPNMHPDVQEIFSENFDPLSRRISLQTDQNQDPNRSRNSSQSSLLSSDPYRTMPKEKVKIPSDLENIDIPSVTTLKSVYEYVAKQLEVSNKFNEWKSQSMRNLNERKTMALSKSYNEDASPIEKSIVFPAVEIPVNKHASSKGSNKIKRYRSEIIFAGTRPKVKKILQVFEKTSSIPSNLDEVAFPELDIDDKAVPLSKSSSNDLLKDGLPTNNHLNRNTNTTVKKEGTAGENHEGQSVRDMKKLFENKITEISVLNSLSTVNSNGILGNSGKTAEQNSVIVNNSEKRIKLESSLESSSEITSAKINPKRNLEESNISEDNPKTMNQLEKNGNDSCITETPKKLERQPSVKILKEKYEFNKSTEAMVKTLDVEQYDVKTKHNIGNDSSGIDKQGSINVTTSNNERILLKKNMDSETMSGMKISEKSIPNHHISREYKNEAGKLDQSDITGVTPLNDKDFISSALKINSSINKENQQQKEEQSIEDRISNAEILKPLKRQPSVKLLTEKFEKSDNENKIITKSDNSSTECSFENIEKVTILEKPNTITNIVSTTEESNSSSTKLDFETQFSKTPNDTESITNKEIPTLKRQPSVKVLTKKFEEEKAIKEQNVIQNIKQVQEKRESNVNNEIISKNEDKNFTLKNQTPLSPKMNFNVDESPIPLFTSTPKRVNNSSQHSSRNITVENETLYKEKHISEVTHEKEIKQLTEKNGNIISHLEEVKLCKVASEQHDQGRTGLKIGTHNLSAADSNEEIKLLDNILRDALSSSDSSSNSTNSFNTKGFTSTVTVKEAVSKDNISSVLSENAPPKMLERQPSVKLLTKQFELTKKDKKDPLDGSHLICIATEPKGDTNILKIESNAKSQLFEKEDKLIHVDISKYVDKGQMNLEENPKIESLDTVNDVEKQVSTEITEKKEFKQLKRQSSIKLLAQKFEPSKTDAAEENSKLNKKDASNNMEVMSSIEIVDDLHQAHVISLREEKTSMSTVSKVSTETTISTAVLNSIKNENNKEANEIKSDIKLDTKNSEISRLDKKSLTPERSSDKLVTTIKNELSSEKELEDSKVSIENAGRTNQNSKVFNKSTDKSCSEDLATSHEKVFMQNPISKNSEKNHFSQEIGSIKLEQNDNTCISNKNDKLVDLDLEDVSSKTIKKNITDLNISLLDSNKDNKRFNDNKDKEKYEAILVSSTGKLPNDGDIQDVGVTKSKKKKKGQIHNAISNSGVTTNIVLDDLNIVESKLNSEIIRDTASIEAGKKVNAQISTDPKNSDKNAVTIKQKGNDSKEVAQNLKKVKVKTIIQSTAEIKEAKLTILKSDNQSADELKLKETANINSTITDSSSGAKKKIGPKESVIMDCQNVQPLIAAKNSNPDHSDLNPFKSTGSSKIKSNKDKAKRKIIADEGSLTKHESSSSTKFETNDNIVKRARIYVSDIDVETKKLTETFAKKKSNKEIEKQSSVTATVEKSNDAFILPLKPILKRANQETKSPEMEKSLEDHISENLTEIKKMHRENLEKLNILPESNIDPTSPNPNTPMVTDEHIAAMKAKRSSSLNASLRNIPGHRGKVRDLTDDELNFFKYPSIQSDVYPKQHKFRSLTVSTSNLTGLSPNSHLYSLRNLTDFSPETERSLSDIDKTGNRKLISVSKEDHDDKLPQHYRRLHSDEMQFFGVPLKTSKKSRRSLSDVGFRNKEKESNDNGVLKTNIE